MNKISIEELKVLGYDIRNGTKDNTLKNEALCSEDDDCRNGGICSEDKVCICAMGYKGKKCEKIVGCDELKCNLEISDCILNEETEEGMCRCKDMRKLYFQHECMGSCRDDSDCYNGGVCSSYKTCSCRIGSAGDHCEIIEGCEELKCDPYISDCIFSVSTEKGMCKCKEEGKVFVNDKCVGK
ncbi:EGF-like domain-containing protein [Trichonephila clavata]|uniref:EGF-like domain-containing protein n=1 Tax=Trichonephila clavata TaxID=2740835 RepID=A0A8X6I1I1_TRICU|nr:EGF-like domain-containing protein [Trichonephila clavata]